MTHDFDFLTDFCVRCGAPCIDAVNRNLICVPVEATNVIAVSHLIARRRFSQLFGTPDYWDAAR